MKMNLTAAAFILATMASAANLAGAATQAFSAKLVPLEEVVDAESRGQAEFQLNADGSGLRYKLSVENVEFFTQAHIHLAPEAVVDEARTNRIREPLQKRENGPIVVFLTAFHRKGISVDGVLSEGVITESDLVGPLKGASLRQLTEIMARKEAYVALHFLRQMGLGNVFCCPVGLRGDIQVGRAP
jgi:hypothetical protein